MNEEKSVVPLADGSVPAVVHGQGRLYFAIDKAVDTLYELMDDKEMEGYVRLNAVNSVLDRVGLGKKSTVDHHHEVTHGLDPQIEQMVERLKRRDTVVARPQIVAPEIEVVGEEVEEAEIVEEPSAPPVQSVVLDFATFQSQPPNDEI